VGDERPDAIRIVIEDEAQQIDPALIRSRDLDEIRPGGLGVHIIKTIMDEAAYEKRSDGKGGTGGMRLTMMKKRVNSTGGKPTSSRGGCGCSDGKMGGAGTEKCNG
jgi:anti-sigma regulatory factor (Ser/Thr protein kinase)